MMEPERWSGPTVHLLGVHVYISHDFIRNCLFAKKAEITNIPYNRVQQVNIFTR